MAAMRPLAPPPPQAGLGIVVPHDMALDRELWRWTPDDVTLHVTRTPSPGARDDAADPGSSVTADMIATISEADVVTAATTDLLATGPAVHAYACTSGSFIRGAAGERALTRAMVAAGARTALTTSGALLAALARLDVTRVSVVTPYDRQLTELLDAYLAEAGVTPVATRFLGLHERIWEVPYETTAQLVRDADHPQAQAIVISCTNLPTYDLVAVVEAEIGKPVVTANQATMWAALDALGRRAVGPGQRLLEVA